MVEGASTPGHLQGSVGLTLDYGHLPFVLWNAQCDAAGNNCQVGDTRSELVQYVAAAHITGSFVILDHLQIGVVLPLALTSGQDFNYTTPGRDEESFPGGDAFVLADPRLNVKGRFFTDTDSGFSLGASGFVTAPTGNAIASGRYVGDTLPSFGGHLIAEISNSGFRASANVGGTWREETQLFSTVVGPQLTYGLGIGYEITPIVGIFGEIVGASTFADQVDEHFLEWRLGGRFRVEDFDINLAGGSGIVSGVGTPMFRIVAGFQWAPIHGDSDGDGVEDSDDNCPTESEDMDGWEDEDGCPEADNDDDGHLDADDPCPDEAEDMDGDRDEDGCPDNDTDRDGIEDSADQCPTEEEDFDGFGDEDGCPETDFDEDGVPDESDQCPEQPEDIDQFEDEDGCPDDAGAPAEEAAPAPAGRRRRGR